MRTKINLLAFAIAVIFSLCLNNVLGQSSTLSHARANTDYLGWDGINGVSGTLDIKNNFASSIDFYTNTSMNPKATITANGLVGIGTAAPSLGKLEIFNDSEANGGYSLTSTLLTSAFPLQTGLYGVSEGASYVNVGVAGEASSSTSSRNYGMVGQASASSTENVGVTGIGDNSAGADNIGVKGIAADATDNTGGLFIATGTTGDKYAVRGTILNTSGGFEAAGYFDGNVWYTGTCLQVSDARFKTNVTNLQGNTALSFIEKLAPKKYEYKTAEYPQIALPDGFQYGLIAQEVETVIPELVQKGVAPPAPNATGLTPNETGDVKNSKVEFKGVNYVGLIPILVSAVKEQQTTIEQLNQRLQALEQGTAGSANTQSVDLNYTSAVVLDQNVPNPFEEQTVIAYAVPTDAASAQMIFYDVTGKTVKSVDLDKGNSKLTVFTSNISSGMYSYSLVVNGTVVETKKMLKATNK